MQCAGIVDNPHTQLLAGLKDSKLHVHPHTHTGTHTRHGVLRVGTVRGGEGATGRAAVFAIFAWL